MLFLQVSQCL